MTSTKVENKALVRRHFQAITDQNWEACAETLAEDVVVHQGGQTHRGIEWFMNHWKDFYDAIPDATIAIDELLAADDKAAIRITNSGTTDSEIPGVESAGTTVEFASHLIVRFEDGVLAELWVVAEQPRPVSQ